MAYTNSGLACVKKISPNRNSPRTHAIDRVSVHCVVGQLSAETMAEMFAQASYQASCNYAIGSDGRVALIVEEKDRSWCTSSGENDHRAVTIECASDRTHPYAVNANVYASLLSLLEDICRRNGKKKLLWFGDKGKTLAYEPAPDEMVMTVHRWFAAKECPGEYLYSRHGKIAAEVTARLAEAAQGGTDRIWMGWVKRESGEAGFKQTNGDSGNAYGKYQFDRRYALVPFLQSCVAYNTGRYGAFGEYVSLGAGSGKLQGNASLAALWKDFCDAFPEEFEMLQDVYAYQHYYLEAAKYIKNLYGIDLGSHSPAVKGTLYSMAIRSGALCAAQKFAGCTDKTADRTMIDKAYAAYGPADVGRWTKAGQWGDALAALDTGEYTEVPVQMPGTAEEPHLYRVRLRWGTDMATQIGAFSSLEKAKALADSAVTGYKVFDETGTAVYDTGELTPADQKKIVLKWALDTAADDSHGYENGKDGRGGPDYACSSFVNEAWRQAGVALPESVKVYTANMLETYRKAGFADLTAQVDLKTGKGLQAGDVCLTPGKDHKH